MIRRFLLVEDRLFSFLVEEVQVVGIKSDLDLLAGLAGSAGINAGDDIAFLGPIPNPQSPIPNPQSPIIFRYIFFLI